MRVLPPMLGAGPHGPAAVEPMPEGVSQKQPQLSNTMRLWQVRCLLWLYFESADCCRYVDAVDQRGRSFTAPLRRGSQHPWLRGPRVALRGSRDGRAERAGARDPHLRAGLVEARR